MHNENSETSAKEPIKQIFFEITKSVIKKLLFYIWKRRDEKNEENTFIGPDGKLIQIINLEEPFTAVRDGEEWHLCIGKYRIESGLKSLRETKKAAKESSWIRLMQVMKIMIMDDQEHQRTNKQK